MQTANKTQILHIFRCLLCGLALACTSFSSVASPLLRCHVTYAGSTQIIDTYVTQDPYSIVAVNIGERFRFKAVMTGTAQAIETIKLYTYFQTRRSDIPIHQATYLPPFRLSETESLLTPKNSLYAGDVERELQYYCSLQEVSP
ncbi:hypothetical protein [Undibacterium sp. TJN19]|uniref:hypothetical protein n=1 Tax=Undibacterium sp. TJN19 TaxID=3413055 RepID=UPI003BF3FA38